MSSPRPMISARLDLIRDALVRVKGAREHFRKVNATASSDTFRIDSARNLLEATVREFGWQWENVEVVLDALAPEEE